MTTTEQDARALAHLAYRLREDTHGAGKWDRPGIWSELSRLIGTNLAVACETVIRHASDPTADTPGAIRRGYLPGPPTPPAFRPPKRDDECPAHPGSHAVGCSGCAADRHAGTPAPPARTRKTPPPPEWAKARAALRRGGDDDD